jgi:hypothetical protein
MPALAAEEAVGIIGMTAGWACELQFAPAFLTELRPFFVLRLALWAFHISFSGQLPTLWEIVCPQALFLKTENGSNAMGLEEIKRLSGDTKFPGVHIGFLWKLLLLAISRR